jgi:hypothetical protein
LNPFGVQASGAPIGTAKTPNAKAVATRQWIHGSGALATGPLPEGIFSVIDRSAHFRSAADAQALLTDLSNSYGTGSSQPVAGSPGTTIFTAPFTSPISGGQITGNEKLVTIQRGANLFTVLIIGGGTRPTSSDAQTLAALQAAAIPASVK